ncbi:hypothetical protein HYSC106933_11025 [Hydrogenibacillus schlegelii]
MPSKDEGFDPREHRRTDRSRRNAPHARGPSTGGRYRFAVPDEALARLQRDPNAELRVRVVDAVKGAGRRRDEKRPAVPLLRLSETPKCHATKPGPRLPRRRNMKRLPSHDGSRFSARSCPIPPPLEKRRDATDRKRGRPTQSERDRPERERDQPRKRPLTTKATSQKISTAQKARRSHPTAAERPEGKSCLAARRRRRRPRERSAGGAAWTAGAAQTTKTAASFNCSHSCMLPR